MKRPTYPQRHPAMAVARNIVNQILDEAGTDVGTRQRINDECDQFVAWMVERYATGAGDVRRSVITEHEDLWCNHCGRCDHPTTLHRGGF